VATALTGGCFCGALRFEADGPIRMRGLCLCRSCQRISGGAGNLFIGLEADGFRYTEGEPQRFARAADAPTREFCARCGTHIAARSPRTPGGVIVKVGALDDPAAFEGPSLVVWTEEAQAFHALPAGIPSFPRLPGR
jgi:hypothetical protein